MKPLNSRGFRKPLVNQTVLVRILTGELGPGSKVAEAGVYVKNRESNWFSSRSSPGISTSVFLTRLSQDQKRAAKTLDSFLLVQIFASTLCDSLIELAAFWSPDRPVIPSTNSTRLE